MVRRTTLGVAFAVLSVVPVLRAQAQPPAPAPQQPNPPAAAQPNPPAPQVPLGALNLQNASLPEVVDSLARQLKLNIYMDPTVKGGVTLNTYGDPRSIDARNLLDRILRINGFAMVQEGDIYRVIPLKEIGRAPIRPAQITNSQSIPEDDQTMLNLIFLKYVAVDELLKVMKEFIGENAVAYPYEPANLLFLLDSRRNMRRTMELIAMFDSDVFANQRVRLFEVKNSRPSDIQKDLENILKSISLDSKSGTVKFLAVDRINTLIAVAPNAGVFDTIEEWLRKLDIPVKVSAGAALEMYVYRVKYGRSDCLAMALGQLFGIPTPTGGYGGFGGGYGANGGGYSPYGGHGSPYGGGYGGLIGGYGNPGGYGNATGFSNSFGGASCSGGINFGGGYGGGGYGYGVPGGYGYPSFGGYSVQGPVPVGATNPNPAGATGQPLGVTTPTQSAPGVLGNADSKTRIVPNPLDNALIIQADPQTLQNILKILKELDVPPRQILLEAKIYEVDLSDNIATGLQWNLQQRSGAYRKPTASLDPVTGLGTFNVGTLVDSGRELLATLTATENRNKVRMLSEPSLIATDSIPASINVGTQVPVSTGSTTIPSGGGTVTTSNVSSQNTGVTLQVAARVNPSGIVTLMIGQQVSGIDNTVQTGSAQTPAFAQQIVQTQITLQDGDTVAIGGTIKDTVTEQMQGIPGLIRIPWFGLLFGGKSKNHQRSELIMFMTPHVIYDETSLLEASDELKTRVRPLKKTIQGM